MGARTKGIYVRMTEEEYLLLKEKEGGKKK